MASNQKRIASAVVGLVLLAVMGCSHLELQSEARSGAQHSVERKNLILAEAQELEFSRGAVKSRFQVVLPAGTYLPIIQTGTGIYYLAQFPGFSYRFITGSSLASNEESRVGGVFVKADGSMNVWFAPKQTTQAAWNLWATGGGPDFANRSFLHLDERPWIEKDFIVQPSAFRVSD